jgi:kinesin family member 5
MLFSPSDSFRAQESNVIVTCRFRPLNTQEKDLNLPLTVSFTPDNKSIIFNQNLETPVEDRKVFTFDHVFLPSSEQIKIYNLVAAPIVDDVLKGFNGTIFAYGQTASGKTFTMTGPDIYDDSNKGIIPRMVETIFEKILDSEESLEYHIKAGFFEVYNEKIYDLVNIRKTDLKVKEDKVRGFFVSGLSEVSIDSVQTLMKLIAFSQENRKTAPTLMNASSSRSHSIFMLTIHQRNYDDLTEREGKLYLVDLAGSEKVCKTLATGKVLEEAKSINLSLTVLGKVISALNKKQPHVPYRDSILTKVLSQSLGGNSKTALVLTCSPSPANESETLSTLRFGTLAKTIKNKAIINTAITAMQYKELLEKAEIVIREKEQKIQELEKRLKVYEPDLKVEDDEMAYRESFKIYNQEMIKEAENNAIYIKELELKVETLLKEIEELQKENDSFKSRSDNFADFFQLSPMKSPVFDDSRELMRDDFTSWRVTNERNELERFKSFMEKITNFETALKEKLQANDEDLLGFKDSLIQILTNDKLKLHQNDFEIFLSNYFQEINKLQSQLSVAEEEVERLKLLLDPEQKNLSFELKKQKQSIERLTTLYQRLSSERTTMKVEFLLKKRKIEELVKENKEQGEEILRLKKKMRETAKSLIEKTMEMVGQGGDAEFEGMISNIRKPIRGRTNFLTKMLESDIKQSRFFTGLLNRQ